MMQSDYAAGRGRREFLTRIRATGIWAKFSLAEIVGQRTSLAARRAAAMRLAHRNGERMKLVIETQTAGLGIAFERAAREGSERVVGNFPAAGPRHKQTMARGDSAQVFVGHRDRMMKSVKQDGVRGL